jgi:hypothetical protein
MNKIFSVPVLSTIVLLTTLTSGLAQARIYNQQKVRTPGQFEMGLAEARVAVREANSPDEVGQIYSKYQRSAFFYCKVTFAFQRGLNYVSMPFIYAGKFTWGLVAGKDVIRMTTGEQGEGLNPQLKLATSSVDAMFEETDKSINGQYGSCTLAMAQMEIAKAEFAQRKGTELKTVIEINDRTDLPVVVIPNEKSGSKK